MDSADKFLLIILGAIAGGLLIGGLFILANRTAGASGLAKTYTNLEEWEVIRDPKTGRTKGVKVKRRAEEAS